MSTEKKANQHFVPQFFLRRFSRHQDNKTVGIYLPHKEILITSGPLRSQASSPYFYGKDGKLENQLSAVEGIAAETLRQVVVSDSPIERGSPGHFKLLFHLLLSEVRTAAHLALMQAQINGTYEAAFEGVEKRPIEYPQLQMTHEKSLQFSMESLETGQELCQDLAMQVVRNDTATPFITGDHPLLRYNQLLEKHQIPGGITGTAHAGIQLFQPIDPFTLVLAYDSRYYKIGCTRARQVVYCTEQDVDAINVLTLMNCFTALYFDHRITLPYLLRLQHQAAKFPAANRTVAQKLYSAGREGRVQKFTTIKPAKPERVLMMSHATSLKTRLQLSFLHFTREAARYVPYKIPANMRPHCAAIRARDEDHDEPRASIKFTYDEE